MLWIFFISLMDAFRSMMNHLLCPLNCFFRYRCSTKHTGKFVHSLTIIKPLYVCSRCPFVNNFFHKEMVITVGRYLGEVGNTDYLMLSSKILQPFPNKISNPSANAGINLVKDEGFFFITTNDSL